jgi:membrane protein
MRLPRGQEFAGLLRVLAHFVAAQRQGLGLHSEALRAAEPFLTDDLLQRYLGDLHRVGLIQRGELGEWMVVRDLGSIDLLEIYEEGAYRLPLDFHGIQDGMAQPASALLDRLGDQVRTSLDVRLAELFPPDVPSTVAAAPAAASSDSTEFS